MRVFIDTNVIFSAILFPGSIPDKALQKSISSPYVPITSDYCLEELKRKFSKKFPHKINALNNFLSVFILCIHVIKVSENITEQEERIRDSKDRPVLRGASESNADIIITGDKDLLESGITKPKSVTPSDFYFEY